MVVYTGDSYYSYDSTSTKSGLSCKAEGGFVGLVSLTFNIKTAGAEPNAQAKYFSFSFCYNFSQIKVQRVTLMVSFRRFS